MNNYLVERKNRRKKRNDMHNNRRNFWSTDVMDFFFCFKVIFPTTINFCVLVAAIRDSASVFINIIAVSFFHTLKNPSVG